MITMTFEDASVESPAIRDKYDQLLGIVATFKVSVGGRVVYCEVQFPVVELRVALARWLKACEDSLEDFELESMESDETGLVWFRRQPSGRWRVGSVHQDDPAIDELDLDDIVRGCERFIAEVDDWVRGRLHREVQDLVEI